MRRSVALFALIGFAILSVALYGRDFSSGPIFQPNIDPFVYIWCLNWWPFSIIHGLNPSLSNYIWNPTGFPMWWANSIPALALILSPITLTLGAVASWNFISLAAPALNAAACFLLLRYLTGKTGPAIIGSMVFGFSSYVTDQQFGHISLSLVPFVPLSVWLVIRRATLTIGRKRYIAAMAVLGVVQFGISTEVLATSAFFGVVAFFAFLRFYRKTHDFSGVVVDTAISAAIAGAVVSPALYSMLVNVKQLPLVINSPTIFSADLLNVLVPNQGMWLGGNKFVPISSTFPGNTAEQGAYLGFGLVIILIMAANWAAGRRWAAPLLIMLGVTSILSLGPVLWVGGHNTRLPLPWALFTDAPIIRHALPTRFTMFVSFVAAIYIALWLSDPVTRTRRAVRYVGVAISLALLLPNPEHFKFGDSPAPAVLSKEQAPSVLGKDANIVVLPFSYLGNSMIWQYHSGMAYRMAGGYVGFAPQSMWKYKAMMYFYDAETPPSQEAFNQSVVDFCKENGVTAIVIAPGTSTKLSLELAGMPWKKEVHGDTTVMRVP